MSRLLARGIAFKRILKPAVVDGISFAAGAVVVDRGPEASALLANEAPALGLRMADADRIPVKTMRQPGPPRIAIYKSWVPHAMGEGHIRWLFDQFEVPYKVVTSTMIQQRNQVSQFDVVIIPSQDEESILEGSNLQRPGDFDSGVGENGIANLREFVQSGGTLIVIGRAAQFAINNFQLPVRDVLKDLPENRFSCPGSILRVKFTVNDPIAFGMPADGYAVFKDGAAFSVLAASVTTVATYASKNILASGWMQGRTAIEGKAAIVTANFGRGRLVVFGFQPHSRGQSYGTFKLLLNAVYAGRRVAQ